MLHANCSKGLKIGVFPRIDSHESPQFILRIAGPSKVLSSPNGVMQVCNVTCFCNPRSESGDFSASVGPKQAIRVVRCASQRLFFVMRCICTPVCAHAVEIHCGAGHVASALVKDTYILFVPMILNYCRDQIIADPEKCFQA